MAEDLQTRFSSSFPVIVYTRPKENPELDWQEFDRGPGFFTVPQDQEIRLRIKGINDQTLAELVQELVGVDALRYLDLSENRNITNEGLARLRGLPQLTGLNLSSCSITSSGIAHLRELHRLETLNLSYCNRLMDPALKTLESMRSLTYVDLQGCLSITQAAISRMRRRSLKIYR